MRIGLSVDTEGIEGFVGAVKLKLWSPVGVLFPKDSEGTGLRKRGRGSFEEDDEGCTL